MTAEMRILAVRQPWSEAIIFGGKDIENRVTNVAGSFRRAEGRADEALRTARV